MTDQLRERRVAEALASVQAGSLAGLEELYDLMSGSVYKLARLITRDPMRAEAATFDVFVQVWTNTWRRPPAPVAGTGWILDLACRCARATRSCSSVSPARAAPRTPRDVSWGTSRRRAATIGRSRG